MSRHTRLVARLLAVAAGATIACSAAYAADNTRYISITGNNANACTLAAPCRTLRRGIEATPAGGELRILDSGAYGSNAVIRKSLTISGNGNTVHLGKSVIVNDADAVVVLRGLTLNGQGAADNDIAIFNAATVHIERCVIQDAEGSGIFIGSGGDLFVLDSIIRDNGFDGISVNPGRVTVIRSTISANERVGLFLVAGTMTIESSAVHGNNTGLEVFPGATARVSNSNIAYNASSGINNHGAVETRQNNTVRENGGFDVTGPNPLTPIGGV
jgi:hypothetical protein